jgi:methionyl-tRNA synthetase
MINDKFYVTTAIDYVNAKPHVGHAFEKTLADAVARYHRLKKEDVFFLTGVDENAQKNVEAAEKAGISVKEFIDKNSAHFLELCNKLNISYSDFIRTTAKNHEKVVQDFLRKLIKSKDIYKDTYEGSYCLGCETYYTEKDLIEGRCPEHKTKPEKRTEEAYFFKLSKYENKLLKIIPKYVIPKSKANEIIKRIKEDGLNNICISRKGAKWGINFPDDKNFKVWVWVDALINYISGLKDKNKYWPAQLHIIGKGINWFHSVIWPALLMSAKEKLPKNLLVHGYINIGGEKMSKSLGNIVDPLLLLNKYEADTVRYSLLKCSVFDDTEYSEEILIDRHNHELANKLGNLISRVSALAEQYGLERTKILDSSSLIKNVDAHFEKLETDKALNNIFSFIDELNELIQHKKPWENKDKKVLYQLANGIKDIAILLSPFIPSTSDKISKTFNFDISLKSLKTPLKISKIKKSEILFRKVDKSPETIDNMPKQKAQKNEVKVKHQETKQISTIAPEKPTKENKDKISYEDFTKVQLKIGKILSVKNHPNADKLYVLDIDLGNEDKRTIVAGLRNHYQPEHLKGKKAVFVANLAPVNLRGIESEGMILAAVNEDDSHVTILTPDKDIPEGSKIR